MKSHVLNAYFYGDPATRTWLVASGEISATDKAVLDILEHPHIKDVQIRFAGGAGETRFYEVVSETLDAPRAAHKYQVKLFNAVNLRTGEMMRFGSCQCAAGAKSQLCRHLIRAAQFDCEMFGDELFTETIIGYKGHIKTKRVVDYFETKISLNRASGASRSGH